MTKIGASVTKEGVFSYILIIHTDSLNFIFELLNCARSKCSNKTNVNRYLGKACKEYFLKEG